MSMVIYEWCVIDPRLDRPFFSSSPPTTLERLPGMEVIRFEKIVPEVVQVDEVITVRDEDTRKIAATLFGIAKSRFEDRKSR